MAMGYNLGPMLINMCEDKYGIEAGRIDGHTKTMEESQEQFETLAALLTEIHAAQQANKHHVDLSEHRELIDKARTYSKSLDRVLPLGTYEWHNEDAIKLVIDTMSQESKKVAMIVNPEMMYINQGLQDIGELVKIFSKILEILAREGEHYVRKQTAGG